MRRSSRILFFLLASTLMPALAEARGFGGGGFHGGGFRGGGLHGGGFHGGGLRAGFGARPFAGVPRAGFRPGLGARLGPGFRGRLGRFGRGGYGLGGVGFGYGLGTLGDVGLGGFGPDLPYGGAAYGGQGYDGGGAGERPVFVPVAVPPPPCPMIIAVNGGLRRAAKTRLVYGSRPACGR